MISTPKSLRLQIGIFGRTNVGKSSLLNMLAGQDVAMTSQVPGTTTDVVEKSMELLPIGPVTVLDTAGIDDVSVLAGKRIERTMKIVDRADVAIIVTEPNVWTEHDDEIADILREKKIPFIIVVNKCDTAEIAPDFSQNLEKRFGSFLSATSIEESRRNRQVSELKQKLLEILPEDFIQPMPLVGDLVPAGGVCIMITPIDLQAPKGRLILPQVQAIRDILDGDAMALVVKEREYAAALQKLKNLPDLVVCDSQVVMKMVADTPAGVKCTTFSILFSRYKGDLIEEVKGAAAIDRLDESGRILIAEACSHHALEDDIGKVKIPRWLRQYVGADVSIDFAQGRDFPPNLSDYDVVIHCGGCMLTRREKLNRIEKCRAAGVPITNYGLAISLMQGVLQRALSPFPAALEAFDSLEK